ncbi:Surfeit locus protein 2 [Monoraphidium neglectum]|uniref:Surfeit locus protein 2 n=1 Tax=Monoraphidium neglectum TaxID=145388 RepID=A0A0D2L6Q6_9CHLO|nr:Surfeit locus protein 2 [Monoraphidium neglectum]KIZ02584.1 Surfeit locus protein 2 [Monoraphidium neglectum]|eukprot:XP_013901603.1 Surfeit locus protein 2 [Monoraphidium neglectum]
MDPELAALVEQHKEHFAFENGKVKCLLNGHSFPARLDLVEAFTRGSKYAKLLQRHEAEQGLSKYEPFIVPSNNFPEMLYCALTGQLIAKTLEAVKLHMKGKKFQRAKERFTADEIELRPEPTLESFGIKVPKQEGGAEDGDEAGTSGSRGVKGSKKPAPKGQGERGGGDEEMGGGEDGGDEDEEEEGGFWVPEGVESSEEEDEEAGGSSGADDGVDGAMLGSDDEVDVGAAGEAMDEDEPSPKPAQAQQQTGKPKGQGRRLGKAAEGRKANKQGQPRQQEGTKAVAANGGGAGANGKQKGAGAAATTAGGSTGGKAVKRNPQKPSAAKKAKR